MSIGDSELVRRSQAGDAGAFDELVIRHSPQLYRVVRRMMPDRLEAEEILQETWLRAWRSLRRFEPERQLFPWLARIAVNAARDSWRVRRPMDFSDAPVDPAGLPALGEPLELRLEREQLLQRLAEEIVGLSLQQRTAIALRYDAGLSYQQIATTMQLPLNTVRTHLHRAKLALRERMEGWDERLAG